MADEIGMGALLLGYAFVSNVALAVLPHEPFVAWCGIHSGVLRTAAIATAGTVLAGWVDHRLFVPLLSRRLGASALLAAIERPFARAPFAILALSGLSPLPFWPFKVLAFSHGYPLRRYVIALAVGRFPRYLLLAWLGATFRLPAWALVVVSLVLIGPYVAGRVRSRRARSAMASVGRKGVENERTTCGDPHDDKPNGGLGEKASATDCPLAASVGDA